MNNASQYMNDLSTLNDDFSQASNYRQNIVGQAKATAEATAAKFLHSAGIDKSMVPHLKMLAEAEGGAAAGATHAVQLVRGGINYVRGNLLSSETNEALDTIGQSSFDNSVGALPGLAKSAVSKIKGAFTRGAGTSGTEAPAVAEAPAAAPAVAEAPASTPIADQTIDNTTTYGGRTLTRRPSMNRNSPEEKDDFGEDNTNEAARMEGEEKEETPLGQEDDLLEGETFDLDTGLPISSTTGTGTGAGVGAGGAAAEISEDAADVAATNWYDVLGWGAALVAVGSAVASGVEAYEAGKDEKTQTNLGNSIKPQIPNMPSFAGRYVVPVQNSIQNE